MGRRLRLEENRFSKEGMETDPLQTVENYCTAKKSIFHVIKQYDNLLENFNILSQN